MAEPGSCGALPNVVVIGAMKCGTTALHHYLDAHPDVSMASQKETNFFAQEWHRGLDWYATLFGADAPVRGETSPGYTSPDHPQVPARMCSVLPDVRLIYLVRNPIDRAVSQYQHHRRGGAERRSLEEALLDARSQYVDRGRYYQRVRPFLDRFHHHQLFIVVQERLRHDRRSQLRRILEYAGADPHWWSAGMRMEWNVGQPASEVPRSTRAAFEERVTNDTNRLRDLMGDELPEWSC